jgi:hypothetical protein
MSQTEPMKRLASTAITTRRTAMGSVARWLIASAFAMTCAFAVAQPRGGLPPEAAAVFDRWMHTSCVGDEARELAEQLRQFKEPLAAAFRRAIAEGPPLAELRAARAAADARYALRVKFPIQDFRIEGVSEKDLAAFGRVTRQAYVDDQVRRFVTGYRANAVAGLGIVGGQGSREVLARIAANRSDPLAAAAREALRQTPG